MKIISFKISILLITFFQLALVWGSTNPLPSSILSESDSTVLEHLQVLSSDEFLGRKFASKGSVKSQSYLVATLTDLNVAAFKKSYRHSFEKSGFFQSEQGTNIIAYIPGTDHVDEYIVLSAHYDHLGIKRNKVYNGADDNASGTAALLHYAKRLAKKPLKYSVILLFTDGEEVNLLGAKAFIEQQKNLLSKVKLNINLDMIAGSKRTKKLRFISRNLPQILSPDNLSELSKLQQEFKTNSCAHLTAGFRNRRSSGSSLTRTNWLMASDHGVFNKAGIPILYFGVGTHKNYHSELDDFDNINKIFYLAAIDIIFQQLIYIDTAMSAG
ncbi:peptidase M28 [Colwellia sp. 75C3]|uniref:M20/M25/M40 family metallo-hydrolase n=1 Tax=Colwellia sp. 75C3 TaxID=888425 RepID=UPI000C31D9EA|nr:M20/M25/M40 family metallo-hydrolase [Colwellia sp. 75C3]PKG80769.1 peptidase M28 [Colwellia sp. 75C3]